ncbi:hypothetical protein GCM10007276_07960 [Agaricicola taiwanensis]|uniref:DUF1194 domain-containing protein n=1 Tax=Agaricicola taiwanensis TaxID=591372 RepID=A0A8J2VME3_9RHOB|nr:DUF1194 domain-containing protein [Agaricicola taiwanensis]GGE33097.1 hypothetical protein GCM10007276_07960 [Agaricicola taiwanensis]
MPTWRLVSLIFAGLIAGHQPAIAATEVDLELVLAVDISYSMDPDELNIQREGYISALTSPEVLTAIRDGVLGKIAVTYVEWAGSETQNVVVGWKIIDSPESASAFAAIIGEAPIQRAFRTSISSALVFSSGLFDRNDFEGIRRVIDISGDGPNNQGPIVTGVRDEVLAKGIVINGLPLVFKRPSYSLMDIEDLAAYYTSCVIGGPGAFVIPVSDKSQFSEAIRTKLVLEIAGNRSLQHRDGARVMAAQATTPEVWACTAGERLWRQRYGK